MSDNIPALKHLVPATPKSCNRSNQTATAPSPSNSAGKLTATIISACDLPFNRSGHESNNSEGQPSHVSMTILGTEVNTGPPNAIHKERNSFKFVEKNVDVCPGTGAANELTVMAPLSYLYRETATFCVVFEDNQNLTASCKIDTTLHINKTQWIILNLEPTKPSVNSAVSTATVTETKYPPTLRLKLTLSAPHRPEIAAFISSSRAWFNIMDTFTTSTVQRASSISFQLPGKTPVLEHILPLARPLIAFAILLLPVLTVLLLLGLPFLLLPFLLLLLSTITLAIIGTAIYLSSPTGRASASLILQPLSHRFETTGAGQRLLYPTGPRPSPVVLARTLLPDDAVGKLLVSLCIDLVGSSSYLLPGVGETFDLLWAPTQTVLLMAMYEDGALGQPGLKYVSFGEEILPFTDWVPSGMIGWCREYALPLVLEEGGRRVTELVDVGARGKREAIRYIGR